MDDKLEHKKMKLLQRRIKRLERIIVILGLLIVVGGLAGWTAREHLLSVDTVIANRIEANNVDIKDNDGQVRCRIGLTPNQDFVSMKLFGSDTNTMRLSMGVSSSTGTTGFALYNKQGKKIIFMTNEADTSTSVTVYNKNGEIATSIVNNGQNNVIFSGNYVVTDRHGATRAIMGLSEGDEGFPYIDLYDKSGNKRVGLFAEEKNTYGLALFDEKSRNRVTLGITQQSNGAAAIIGSDGNILWKAP
ncbi:MAG: hypothetical protein HYZ44_05510 [Bacteroidetes bacterium]|nr:hypothetical protein [Bacteroidota bacterium]